MTYCTTNMDRNKVLEQMEEAELLTIDECQRLELPVRDDLELLDYEVRCAFARILADVDKSGGDSILFMRASTTVILSIAAGLFERMTEQTNKPFDVTSFVAGAESAAKWAKTRKLRYFLEGEG